MKISDRFSLDQKLILYPGDVNYFLKTIPDETIKLIITSHPYNVGKEYEVRVSIEKYLEQQEETINRVKEPIGLKHPLHGAVEPVHPALRRDISGKFAQGVLVAGRSALIMVLVIETLTLQPHLPGLRI